MRLNSGQKLILIIIVIVIILVLGWSLSTKSQIASLKIHQKQTEDLSEKNLNNVKVTAKNGQFRPNEFEVPLSSSIVIQVEAVDRDYNFQLTDFGINKSLPKGKTTQVKIDGLGVGEYKFNCGQNCQGIVEVLSKSDEED